MMNQLASDTVGFAGPAVRLECWFVNGDGPAAMVLLVSLRDKARTPDRL